MRHAIPLCLCFLLALAGGPRAEADGEAVPTDGTSADAPPPVFARLTWDAAAAQAAAEKKLLVLDATSRTCSPCRHMDRTTWRDDALVAWLERHAVAIQLIMSDHEVLKTDLGIEAYPTIVVLQGGEELERIVGARDAAFMLEWLEGLRNGRTRARQVREAYEAFVVDATGGATPEAVASLLADLVEVGMHAEATNLCVRLWTERVRGADLSPAVWSSLHRSTAWLCGAHAPAREALAAIRDLLAPGQVDARPSDWLLLNGILASPEHVVNWAAQACLVEQGRREMQALGMPLFNLLVEHGRWAEAGHALADPLDAVRFHTRWRRPGNHAIPAIPMGMRPAGGADAKPPTVEELLDRRAEDFASDCYAALLAAGRIEEARAVAAELLDARDTARARTALVAKALRAGQLAADEETHRRWLDEALR